MRADKLKNIAKVAKELLENPLQTEREIAESIGVNHTTVNRAKQELQQIAPKDDRIVGLTDEDFNLMTTIQKEKFRRLQEPEKINDNDLDKWENTATKRYSLFRGNATDEQGGLKYGKIEIEVMGE